MKKTSIGILALGLLLTGCGSAPMYSEPDVQTTAEMSVPTTEEKTESETEAETEAELTETEPVIPPAEVVDGDIAMRNGVLVVNNGTDHARALEVFSENNQAGSQFAGVLNSFKTTLSSDVNVYCMVIPTSAAYYVPESEQAQFGDQEAQYEHIAAELHGVTGVPLYEALLYHRDEPLYSRTDYHWQPLGAYYAAAELAKAANVPFAELETYEKVEREGYVGAFAAVNDISELYDAAEPFTYYKPANLNALSCHYYDTDFTNGREGSLFHENLPVSSSYTIFVGVDDCIFQADTDADNDRVLVIFKDSYGNALLPFLTESFSTIYLCDFRFFDTDVQTFLEQVGATDIVFAMSTVACTTSVKVDTLANTLGVG